MDYMDHYDNLLLLQEEYESSINIVLTEVEQSIPYTKEFKKLVKKIRSDIKKNRFHINFFVDKKTLLEMIINACKQQKNRL